MTLDVERRAHAGSLQAKLEVEVKQRESCPKIYGNMCWWSSHQWVGCIVLQSPFRTPLGQGLEAEGVNP